MGPLEKGLRQAAARVKAWGASLTAIGAKLTGFGAALLAPLAGATKLFADMGSELLDMSQRTGLSVEALSELQFAAGQSGLSIEDLETSLARMTRVIADAAGGSQEAQQALADLGLSAEELLKLQPDQQLNAFADALAGIYNPTIQGAKAMDVFGKSGRKMLPMLRQGEAGLEALREQARAGGLVWSREEAEAAEAFGDQLTVLWGGIQRGVALIGGALVPALKGVVTAITEGAASFANWIKDNREVVVAVGLAAAGVTALGIALTGLGVIVSIVGAGLKLLLLPFTVLSAVLGVLKVQTILSATLWAAWSATVLVAKAAVWLLNAGLVVLNALLAGTGIVSAVASFVAIGAALTAVAVAASVAAAAIYGIWKAGQAVFGILGQLSTTTGPLGAVSGIFREWGSILRDVFAALQEDGPAAWALLQAGARLALEQIKALWPPLWEFIKKGWEVVSFVAAQTFELQFQKALATILAETSKFFDVFGIATAGINRELARITQGIEAQQQAFQNWGGRQVQELVGEFKFEETPAIKEARAEVERLRAALAAGREARAAQGGFFTELFKRLTRGAGEVQKQLGKTSVAGALGGLGAEFLGAGNVEQKQLDEERKQNAQLKQIKELLGRGALVLQFG